MTVLVSELSESEQGLLSKISDAGRVPSTEFDNVEFEAIGVLVEKGWVGHTKLVDGVTYYETRWRPD